MVYVFMFVCVRHMSHMHKRENQRRRGLCVHVCVRHMSHMRKRENQTIREGEVQKQDQCYAPCNVDSNWH